MTLFHPFFQQTIMLTTKCNLRCFHCPLWTQGLTSKNEPNQSIKTSILNNTFFNLYPKKKQYHIIGGEPLLDDNLLQLSRFLTKQNIKVNVWTHAQLPPEVYEQLHPFVNRFFLYLPAAINEEYCHITGTDGLDHFKMVLEFLLERGKHVVVNFPIRPDNIQFLPNSYELSYDYKVPLLVHYNHYDSFSKESRRYIKRFRDIKDVYVYKTRLRKQPQNCLGYPVGALDNVMDYGIVGFYRLINGIRSKIGL